MRIATIVGIALIVCAPFALLIGNLLGLITNLTDTIQIVIVSLVPAMIVSGASLIWLARKPDEQELRRREDIHGAIKKWLESKQDVYPLVVKPPELTVEIENCLSRKYRSIWADIQELRRKHCELLAIESGKYSDEFWDEINGVRAFKYPRKRCTCSQCVSILPGQNIRSTKRTVTIIQTKHQGNRTNNGVA